SKCKEDVYINNHTSVWGSWWKDHQWGYKCCKQTIRNSCCIGAAGIGVAEAATDLMKANIDGKEASEGLCVFSLGADRVQGEGGHTTITWPHRVCTEYGVIAAPHKNTHKRMDFVFQHQLRPRIPFIKAAYVIADQVCCAAIRYHNRHVSSLEFHPIEIISFNLVIRL
ncbi:hypothetical protein Tsubulata_025835, partial [Turnera subulata]